MTDGHQPATPVAWLGRRKLLLQRLYAACVSAWNIESQHDRDIIVILVRRLPIQLQQELRLASVEDAICSSIRMMGPIATAQQHEMDTSRRILEASEQHVSTNVRRHTSHRRSGLRDKVIGIICCMPSTCNSKYAQTYPAEAAFPGRLSLSSICLIDVRIMHGAGLNRQQRVTDACHAEDGQHQIVRATAGSSEPAKQALPTHALRSAAHQRPPCAAERSSTERFGYNAYMLVSQPCRYRTYLLTVSSCCPRAKSPK